jgi:hypothetical protein
MYDSTAYACRYQRFDDVNLAAREGDTMSQSRVDQRPVGVDGPRFNRALSVMVVVALALSGSNLLMPSGQFLPVWLLIIQMFAIAAMLMMHVVRRIGIAASVIYLVAMMAWEFLSEQVDIITHGGWYGAHFAYTDAWGPQLLGVPIVPPVSIAVLVWPVVCLANLWFYRSYNVDHSRKPWLETIFFAACCGVLVSWMPVVYEAVSINTGAYTYPQIEAGEVHGYWGVPIGTDKLAMPAGVFLGFSVLVALQVITLVRWIGPRFARRTVIAGDRLHPLLDVVPIAFLFVMALGLAKIAMTVEARIFAIYTGAFYAATGLFAFYRLMRERSATQSATAGPTP